MAITIMISTSVKPLFFIFVPPWNFACSLYSSAGFRRFLTFFSPDPSLLSSITPFRIPPILIFVLPECGHLIRQPPCQGWILFLPPAKELHNLLT